jgi:hypothetical protein
LELIGSTEHTARIFIDAMSETVIEQLDRLPE